MKRRDFWGWRALATGPLAFFAEETLGALAHFSSGLVGEGDGQDPLRRDATADEFRNAVGDDARLAGACTSEHQERAFSRAYGLELSGVEPVTHEPSEMARNRIHHTTR